MSDHMKREDTVFTKKEGSSTTKKEAKASLIPLYLARTLAAWGDRTWQFVGGMFMLRFALFSDPALTLSAQTRGPPWQCPQRRGLQPPASRDLRPGELPRRPRVRLSHREDCGQHSEEQVAATNKISQLGRWLLACWAANLGRLNKKYFTLVFL